MEHPAVGHVRELYEARTRHDVDAIHSILDENVVWHEPELEAEHTDRPDADREFWEQA
jgi:hypothetical protein